MTMSLEFERQRLNHWSIDYRGFTDDSLCPSKCPSCVCVGRNLKVQLPKCRQSMLQWNKSIQNKYCLLNYPSALKYCFLRIEIEKHQRELKRFRPLEDHDKHCQTFCNQQNEQYYSSVPFSICCHGYWSGGRRPPLIGLYWKRRTVASLTCKSQLQLRMIIISTTEGVQIPANLTVCCCNQPLLAAYYSITFRF